MTRLCSIVVLVCILGAWLGSQPARAETPGPVVGVNAAIGGMSIEQQDAILAALYTAGVHEIRSGITGDEKGINFARRAHGLGIRILWLVQLQYKPGASS